MYSYVSICISHIYVNIVFGACVCHGLFNMLEICYRPINSDRASNLLYKLEFMYTYVEVQRQTQ